MDRDIDKYRAFCYYTAKQKQPAGTSYDESAEAKVCGLFISSML